MGKRDKLRERLKNNPTSARFSDIRKLLGMKALCSTESRAATIFFLKDDINFVIPVHNNKVKTVYVKRVIELIEQKDS